MRTRALSLVGASAVLGLLLALVLLCPPGLTLAGDQVVSNTNDDGPGSLRQAIRDVHDGGTISFNLGAGAATITLTSGELSIAKSLTLAGPGADGLTISGNDSSRVLSVLSGTVTLSGLTVAHGLASGNPAEGGAIRNAGHLILQQVTVEASRAEGAGGTGGEDALGGGLYSEGACLLDRSTVISNTAEGGALTGGDYGGDGQGGGIYNRGLLTLTQSSVLGNLALGDRYPAATVALGRAAGWPMG